MQLHLTTTHIRALVETTATDLCDEGKIDARQRKAVSNINGHSSATVDKYYMKRSRKHDVEHGKKMFEVPSANKPFMNDRYISNQTRSSDNDDNDDIYDRYNSNQDESSDNDPIIEWDFGSSTKNQPFTGKKVCVENNNMWGRLHPQYAADTQRIKWSDQEKNYIRRWLENAGQGSSQHRVKDLLDHIRKDEHARAIFHVNHIVDGTRLRHGIRTVEDDESNMVKNPYNYNKAIYYDPI